MKKQTGILVLALALLTSNAFAINKTTNEYLEREVSHLSQSVKGIIDNQREGKITTEQAKFLLDMSSHALHSVLLTCEGLGNIKGQRNYCDKAIDSKVNEFTKKVEDGSVNQELGFWMSDNLKRGKELLHGVER